MCDVKGLKAHKVCHTPDDPIVVYVQKGTKTLGICRTCWDKVADKDWEVGDLPRPTMEEILSDKERFGDNPVETEYILKGKREEESSNEDEEENL